MRWQGSVGKQHRQGLIKGGPGGAHPGLSQRQDGRARDPDERRRTMSLARYSLPMGFLPRALRAWRQASLTAPRKDKQARPDAASGRWTSSPLPHPEEGELDDD